MYYRSYWRRKYPILLHIKAISPRISPWIIRFANFVGLACAHIFKSTTCWRLYFDMMSSLINLLHIFIYQIRLRYCYPAVCQQHRRKRIFSLVQSIKCGTLQALIQVFDFRISVWMDFPFTRFAFYLFLFMWSRRPSQKWQATETHSVFWRRRRVFFRWYIYLFATEARVELLEPMFLLRHT